MRDMRIHTEPRHTISGLRGPYEPADGRLSYRSTGAQHAPKPVDAFVDTAPPFQPAAMRGFVDFAIHDRFRRIAGAEWRDRLSHVRLARRIEQDRHARRRALEDEPRQVDRRGGARDARRQLELQ